MKIHLKPIDGMRALTHLSLIFLHTAMLTTAHLPSSGPLWEAIKNHWIFTCFQAGGIQVDIMFMMSAFLLVYGLISNDQVPDFFSYAIRRALRMIPSIAVLLFVGYLMSDCWDLPYREIDQSAGMIPRMASILFLINNYFDQSKYGSLTASLSWSCAADFQMSLVVFLIVTYLRRNTDKQNKLLLAQRLKYVFVVLILLALVIRGLIFDKDTRNMMKLGQYSHFGLLLADSSYAWFKATYNHVWYTTNSAKSLSQEYLSALYMPTHSRFGPFAVGGLLACNIYTVLNDLRPSAKSQDWFIRKFFSFIITWFLTGVSILMLAIPCTAAPPLDQSPIEAQLITTAAIRTIAASAAAYLLYRSLLPSTHPSSWPTLSYILSLPPFQFLASISFCSYLIHFRLLMEIILNPSVRAVTGLTLPPVLISPEDHLDVLVNKWITYIILNGVLGTVLSILLATLFYYGYEKPMTSFVKRMIDSQLTTNSSLKNKKE